MTLGLWQMLAWAFVAFAWWFGAKSLAGVVLRSRARWATLIVSCALTGVAWALASAWNNVATIYLFFTGLMVTIAVVVATLAIDPATDKAVGR